uniref:Uncharacterized protein n=1 Tax=Fagus sylvatica TaxID=28930 RepID=A0A2N9HPX0_FAGSY
MGDLQTGRDRARQGLAAGWGGSLLRGVANGVGLTLVWVVLWLYRSEGISFAAWPWAGSRLWFGWCSGCTDLAKERRESK